MGISTTSYKTIKHSRLNSLSPKNWLRLFLSRSSLWERLSALAAGIGLLATLFLPVWWIHLISGQYPEGLNIWIWTHHISGQLEDVNILNHYIGMAPLKTSAFPEFTWLGTAIEVYAGLALLTAILGWRAIALLTWLSYLVFDLVMMVDMYHWLWLWGHHLDHRAPIRIPGFTPPLLGVEHIANFHIWSVPAWGGLLMILATLLGPVALWWQLRQQR